MFGMKCTILALVPSLGTVHSLHVWVGCAGAGAVLVGWVRSPDCSSSDVVMLPPEAGPRLLRVVEHSHSSTTSDFYHTVADSWASQARTQQVIICTQNSGYKINSEWSSFSYILQLTLQIIDIFPWDYKIVFHMCIGLSRLVGHMGYSQGNRKKAKLKDKYLSTKILNS